MTFNYRGNPLVQQARLRDRARRHRHAALPGRPVPAGLAAEGHRLLVAARARQGRRLVGARRHRLALVRSRAARQRPAHHARARRHHHRHPEAEAARGLARGVRRPPAATRRSSSSTSRSRISRRCCCGSTTARRARSRSGRSAPATRTISILEICGSKASLRWRQEQQNELLDRPPRQGQRDPAEGSVAARRRSPRLRAPARRTPGVVGGRVLPI